MVEALLWCLFEVGKLFLCHAMDHPCHVYSSQMFHTVLVWCWVPMGCLCLQELGYMHYWVALLIHSVFLTVLIGIESAKQKIKNHNL